MNSKLIFVLALAIFCLNVFLAVDALPAGLETRDVALADPALEDRANPISSLAYILCVSKCFQVCSTYKISTVVCYYQNKKCFDYCGTLDRAVKAREETDTIDAREEIKRDVESNPPLPPFPGFSNLGFTLPPPQEVGEPGTCEKLGPVGTAVPCKRDLEPHDDVERGVEASPPFALFPTWITIEWIVKFNTCMQRCPQACSTPFACPTAQTFCHNWCLKTTPRTSLRRDLAIEEGKSIVRRTDTKSSLKQVTSLNATAIAYGTASTNATSALDSAAAAVVMNTTPSDLVPWDTAMLRWNACQSICLNFCYTINIPDPGTCKAQFGQCWFACLTKFEQSVGIIAKRSTSSPGPLTPRVESNTNLRGPVQNPAVVTCREECQAPNEECLYSEAYCADSLKDCLTSCNSKHSKAKARGGLDVEARDEIEPRDVYTED